MCDFIDLLKAQLLPLASMPLPVEHFGSGQFQGNWRNSSITAHCVRTLTLIIIHLQEIKFSFST